MDQPTALPGPTKPSRASVFFAFFRLGITAFGGPAMVSYIRKMVVGQKGWLDGATFDDGIALCQAIPDGQSKRKGQEGL
jgi:chromate transporter